MVLLKSRSPELHSTHYFGILNCLRNKAVLNSDIHPRSSLKSSHETYLCQIASPALSAGNCSKVSLLAGYFKSKAGSRTQNIYVVTSRHARITGSPSSVCVILSTYSPNFKIVRSVVLKQLNMTFIVRDCMESTFVTVKCSLADCHCIWISNCRWRVDYSVADEVRPRVATSLNSALYRRFAASNIGIQRREKWKR